MKKIVGVVTSLLALGFLGYLMFESIVRILGYSDRDPLIPILGVVMILIWSTVVQQIVEIKNTIHTVWSWVMIQRFKENPDQFRPEIPQSQRADLN